MDSHSVFFDEWLRSLRAQYKQVVRNNDRVTLPTLTAVLQNVGFGEAELAQLRIEATMHVDDVAEDFKPDMQILDPAPASQPHPAECICPQCMPIDEAGHDVDGQPILSDPEAASAETGHTFPVAPMSPTEAEEPEPQSFEDSLDEQAEIEATGPAAEDSAEDDGAADDPDAPAQMSLF